MNIVRMPRRLGVVFGVLALTALAVSPALATDLKDGQGNISDAEWVAAHPDNTDCVGDTTPSGSTLWHFILNDHGTAPDQASGTVTLTATFTDEDGNPVAPYVVVQPNWVDNVVYHFNVITPSGYTLVDASTDKGGSEAELLLSHVCIGEPGTEVPESPASVLLVLTSGLLGLFFIRRQSIAGKATAA
jgi:hypothetical protein